MATLTVIAPTPPLSKVILIEVAGVTGEYSLATVAMSLSGLSDEDVKYVASLLGNAIRTLMQHIDISASEKVP